MEHDAGRDSGHVILSACARAWSFAVALAVGRVSYACGMPTGGVKGRNIVEMAKRYAKSNLHTGPEACDVSLGDGWHLRFGIPAS